MRRRLYALPVVALLAGTVLLLLAATAAPAPPHALAILPGRTQVFPDGRLWPVAVRLGPAPSEADVVLTVRLRGAAGDDGRLAVEVCASDACTVSQQVWAADRVPAGTVAVGRVGSVEPGEELHLGIRLVGARGRAPRVDVNASPCAAPAPRDLWRIVRTGLPARSNTVAGLENCSTRPAPYLPYALEVLGVGVAVVVGSRRFGP